MLDRFVGESIRPVPGTGDTSAMAIGEPGLPRKFVWRDRTITIVAVLRTWRETGRCRNGSRERYVRKHWYEVATIPGGTMRLYFDRHPRSGRRRNTARWWLFSISGAAADPEGRQS
ncbi:MAG: DUF6504 family protein [Hyphomicrobiales bacterium]